MTDHEALPGLLEAEIQPLYRFCLTITRDEHRAADLAQDTLARALERSDQFRAEGTLGAWLRQIAHRLAIDHARRDSRIDLLDDAHLEAIERRWGDDDYTVDAAVVAERAQLREELEDALVHLPFIYRSTVLLHDVAQWTLPEIARLTEISLPAAKQRLRRGRMALVSLLADGHERRHTIEGVPLRCWDARRHVSDYLDGLLDPEVAHGLEAHLAGCPTCPPLYAALVGVHDH
ncbi:MAG: sigma-70 family RNA polymerase sigma factor, partial [Acidimicrobiales bacterium]|nr:sigma-70 family RNA polymerase sigma factor [Acidimicrobiales bacterium]